jgi:hypothetical protein
VDLYVECSISALEVLRVIIFRELNLDSELFALFAACNLLLETGDEGV